MTGDELTARTEGFALMVVAVVKDLPRGRTAEVLGRIRNPQCS